MKLVKLVKVVDISSDWEERVTSLVDDQPWIEVSDGEYVSLKDKMRCFNNYKYHLNPTPDFNLLLIENVLKPSIDNLLDETYQIKLAEDKKLESAKVKREIAAKKRAEKKEQKTIEDKRKQLEKLKAELGEE